MARITCRTPSTGKPIQVIYEDVPATFTTIAEAVDFSIPDASTKYDERDSADDTRAARPGELFFLTPLSARNKTTTEKWVEVQLVMEDGVVIQFGKVAIPPEDTAFIPMQGRSLLKRVNLAAASGDQLQIRAETAGTIDVWANAEQKLSNEHFGVV
jgi:hypothetical protein